MDPSLKALADKPLVEACLSGHQDAWVELIARYSRLVLAIPRRYGLGEEDAHDVFQSVFAFLVGRLSSVRDRDSLAKWLITTTHRTAWRHMQQQGPSSTVPLDGLGAPDEALPPPELAMRWEQQHALRQALRRLGGRCEELLTALYLAEPQPGYDEIARRLGIPRGSIGPTRARCLARLLAVFRGDHPDKCG
jgi:RNA polymerase sigma factor (sigma-70 family)